MTTLFSRAFRKMKSSFAKMPVKVRLIPVFDFLTPVSHGDVPNRWPPYVECKSDLTRPFDKSVSHSVEIYYTLGPFSQRFRARNGEGGGGGLIMQEGLYV